MVLILINNSLHILPASENDLFKGTLLYVLHFPSFALLLSSSFALSTMPHFSLFQFTVQCACAPCRYRRALDAVFECDYYYYYYYAVFFAFALRFGLCARVGRNFFLSFHFGLKFHFFYFYLTLYISYGIGGMSSALTSGTPAKLVGTL